MELAQNPSARVPVWKQQSVVASVGQRMAVVLQDPGGDTIDEAVAIRRKLYAIFPNDNLGVRLLIEEYEIKGFV